MLGLDPPLCFSRGRVIDDKSEPSFPAKEFVLASRLSRELESVERLARVLDEGVRLPLVNLRVPLDPLIGLIPGVGDLASAVLGASIVVRAVRLGIPGRLIMRMTLNVLVDFAVGSVPVAGDVFDFFFRANKRNMTLLREYLERQEAANDEKPV